MNFWLEIFLMFVVFISFAQSGFYANKIDHVEESEQGYHLFLMLFWFVIGVISLIFVYVGGRS